MTKKKKERRPWWERTEGLWFAIIFLGWSTYYFYKSFRESESRWDDGEIKKQVLKIQQDALNDFFFLDLGFTVEENDAYRTKDLVLKFESLAGEDTRDAQKARRKLLMEFLEMKESSDTNSTK